MLYFSVYKMSKNLCENFLLVRKYSPWWRYLITCQLHSKILKNGTQKEIIHANKTLYGFEYTTLK